MLSLRRLSRTLPAALPLALLASPATAQSPVLYTIDANASQFTFGGTTSLGPIVGSPNTFGLSGDVNVLLTAGTTQPIDTIRLVAGGDALISPDLNATVPNPVPFLPPLASVVISNLRLEFESSEAPVDAMGVFTVSVTATGLSGTATVTPLVGMPSSTDLTGTVSTPQAFTATISQSGTILRIEGPLTLSFVLMDSGTGLSATVNVDGTIAADYAGPAPANYCTAAPNSTGGAGAIGTAGSTSLFAADLELLASGLPQASLGYFLFSDAQDFVPGFGGSQGNLCLGGGIFRLSSFVQNSGGSGSVALPLPFAGLPAGASLDPGESWNFQYWFRDLVGGTPTSNTTDGIQVVFVP
ncbi:MAG: hypothetical protein AAGB93_25265 [Planctomycetota bacterium]